MAKFKSFKIKNGPSAGQRSPVVKRAKGLGASLFGGTVNGIKESIEGLDITSEAILDAFAAAVHEEAIRVMDQSQNIVPVDTGKLKESAVVKAPKTNKRPESSLTYNTDYALIVHETHAGSAKNPGPRAGYLLNPMRAASAGLESRLAEGIRKHAAKGTRLNHLKDKKYK